MKNIEEWAKRVDDLLESETPESLKAWLSKYEENNPAFSEYIGAGRLSDMEKVNFKEPFSYPPAKKNCTLVDMSIVDNYYLFSQAA